MINTYSNPTDLKITDMRFVDIDGAPKRCTILKIMTNQGITGYGEVRDASSKTYALMLKSRILGENPCNVDRIFPQNKAVRRSFPSGRRRFGHRNRTVGFSGQGLRRADVSAFGRQIP